MTTPLLRSLQWLGVAAALFAIVGLTYDFNSEAGKTMNAPVEDALSQGLLGYWKMDEGTGTSTTADASGNANALTMTAMESGDWVAGQIGAFSLDFDGSAEWLTVADPASGILDFTDGRDFTITGWFNRDTENTLDTVVAKRNGDAAGDTGYMIWLGTNDFLNFEISDGTDQYLVTSSATYATTGWHQFVATWKDSLGMSLYVDGILVGSTVTSTASIGSLANAVAFRIGAESSTGTENPFDGKIDDVRIYGSALPANEVSRLYQTTVPGNPVDTGLVGHWTFDGNDVNWGDTGLEIKDVSGKGNHGAVSGLTQASVTPGKLGQALSFNGTSDYVDAGSASGLDNIDLQGGGGLSVSLWAYRTANGTGYLVDKGDGYNNGWTVFASNTQVCFEHAYSSNMETCSDTEYGLNSWIHIVVTWDGGSSTTGVHFYANSGEVNRVYNVNGSGSKGSDAGYNFHIGGSSRSGFYEFPGRIDDVRVYNRVLSTSEILSLYNQAK